MIRSLRAFGLVAILLLAASASASDYLDDRYVDVLFEIEQETTFGTSVFVLGDRPELGGGDVTKAIRLNPNGTYPVWRATIAMPRGLAFDYQFYTRNDSAAQLSNANNGTAIGSEQSLKTEPPPQSFSPVSSFVLGSTSYDRGQWEAPGGALDLVGFTLLEPGLNRFLQTRIPEARWRLQGSQSNSSWYPQRADRVWWQNNLVYDYPIMIASPSAPRLVTIPNVASPQLGNSRSLRVYLPRGYDSHPNREYPVVYMHDGQNIFRPGGPFGCWFVEDAAATTINEGAIPEVIVVGIDNTSGRLTEYVPPYSQVSGQDGRGDLYIRFLVETVIPRIEQDYRVKRTADARCLSGSSLGGLISMYGGWERPDVFGRVASLSGSFWIEEIINELASEPKRDIVVYLDSGNAGTSNDSMTDTNNVRDALLGNGYVLNRDLFHVIGYGQQHNEAAWANRFPNTLRMAMGAHRENRRAGDVNGDGTSSDIADLVTQVRVLRGEGRVDSRDVAETDADGNGETDDADLDAMVDRLLGR